jgi:putative NIF3 family GTP cyclohydrolase 1 type 2
MRRAHSYEEPAFDVVPLHLLLSNEGEGRIGKLTKPVPLAELAAAARAALRSGPVQVVGDGAKPVGRVALACGAAGEFLSDAAKAGAEAFVTGEMRFHDYLAARTLGVGLVLPGHYATERFAVEELAEKLGREWAGVEVWASRREADPVTWV